MIQIAVRIRGSRVAWLRQKEKKRGGWGRIEKRASPDWEGYLREGGKSKTVVKFRGELPELESLNTT